MPWQRRLGTFLGADVGIGVTGVAGPDMQEEKPVGTVHIAVAGPDRVSDTSQHFRGVRTEIKWRAAITAINLLRLHLCARRRASRCPGYVAIQRRWKCRHED